MAYTPYGVRKELCFITLGDGIRLACHLWLPTTTSPSTAGDGSSTTSSPSIVPSPAVLEILPYWASVWTAPRDELRHPYIAYHGYACVRVDMRGSGDSEGLLLDEYLKQEQDDTLEVMEWIAKQPWYSGGISMYGKSWGGFNGLQVAALRPPHLRCVVSLYSTDDRFTDDVHYIGGCLMGSWMLTWSTIMFAWNARPPNPQVLAQREDLQQQPQPALRKAWSALWHARLSSKACDPWVEQWVRHQCRDEYWQHGSICQDYGDVQCPVLLIGGWADGYTNPVFRMLKGLAGRAKAIVGPWSHEWPDSALPGPQIGYLQECLCFWDRHLKGKVMMEAADGHEVPPPPDLKVFLRDVIRPVPQVDTWPGRWVQIDHYQHHHGDSNDDSSMTLQLDGTGLNVVTKDAPPPAATDDEFGGYWRPVSYDVRVGVESSGSWCSFGGPDLPLDQRADDAYSTVFETTSPLPSPVDLLGLPHLTLLLRTTATTSPPQEAHIIARLCHLSSPSSSSSSSSSFLLTRGVLNLTHRLGHSPTDLQPIHPHQDMLITIPMDAVGVHLPAGSRLRLSLSLTYWPLVWPAPSLLPIDVHSTRGHLYLPLLTDHASGRGDTTPIFAPVAMTPPLPQTELKPPKPLGRKVTYDLVTGMTELVIDEVDGRVRHEHSGIEYEERATERYSIMQDDPLSARVVCRRTVEMVMPFSPPSPGGGDVAKVKVDVEASMGHEEGEGASFVLSHRMRVTTTEEEGEGGEEAAIFEKEWASKIERQTPPR